jgi:hypothetical protein
MVKTVMAMALETETVARQQQKQGSSISSGNVGGGQWHLTAAMNNSNDGAIDNRI